jgi:hypothetical protein
MKNYYPSNGTDGMIFISNNCDKCYKCHTCTILTGSFLGKEPKQWIYDKNNNPICTSLKTERPRKNKSHNQNEKLF